MNIYEAAGVAFVLLMTFIGVTTTLYFLWNGAARLKHFVDEGRYLEQSAVGDKLDAIAKSRQRIPGVIEP